MPILRLNAGPDGLVLHRSPACTMRAVQGAATGAGPVIVLVHGFKYDPDCSSCSPHTSIFGLPAHKTATNDVQWLRHLGFGTGRDGDEGLAIAFAWRGRGNLWRAERAARAAGRHLAQVIGAIHRRAPRRPIHIITHSMGSEVAFEALHDLPAGAVQRIIALTGASYAARATKAMQTPAGQAAELFNITSRENDVFDFMYERLMAPPVRGDRAMSAGIALPHAVNIQLDCPRTLAALTRFGGHVSPASRRMCHWSGYTRPGVLRFYARILRTPDSVVLKEMQVALPAHPAPRWSRLFSRPAMGWTLPAPQKAAT